MTHAAPIYLPRDGGLIGLCNGLAVRLEPADVPDSGAVMAIVPGEDVLITDVELPPVRQASRRFQAARYALEDQLASSVDTLHLALGPRASDGLHPSAVVDREQMEAWLDTFGDERTLVTGGMVPDYLCLPPPGDDAASLWLMDDRALFRRDAHHGFACESALLAAMLRAPDMPTQLRVRVQSGTDADDLLQRLRDHGYEVSVTDRPEPDEMLADLLTGLPARPSLDLLQDRYAPVSAMDQWWRPLRATAALALTWLGLAVVAQGVHYYQLQSEYERIRSEAETRFRQAFPNVQSVNNIRVQAEQEIRKLRAQQGTDGLFPLLATTADAAGGIPELQFRSLQYRDGELFLSLRGENVQAVEKLRAGFAETGGARLEIQNADASSDGVDIRARVSRREGA